MTMVLTSPDLEVSVRRDRAYVRWLTERGERWMRKHLKWQKKDGTFSISSEHADDFIKDLKQHDIEVTLK